MTLWPVPRALALLLLIQTLKLVESTDSQSNPVSQPAPSSSTPSNPDPGGGQSPSSPPGTPSTGIKNKSSKFDPSNFTVLTLNSQGSDTKENDTSQYELKQLSNNLGFQYEFKDGAKCVALKHENKEVYKHDKNKHKDQFPRSIFLHLQSKRVYLALKDSMFVYTHKNNKWTETEANLVQLDISKKDSTSEYDCLAKDNVGIYTANGNFLFQEVIRKKPRCECGSDHTFIQATDPGEYVYKVVRDGTDLTKSASNVNLYLINGDVKKFHKVSSGRCSKTWSEGGELIKHICPQKIQIKGVMVAMNDEKSTDEFEFSKADKTMTYTAKEGYGFNEVKWLRSAGHIMRADRNVWKAPNSSNLAHKVVVKCLGWLRYDLYVYQFHGGLQVYHRPAWGSEWLHTNSELLVDKSENIDKSEHPKQLTVLTLGKDGSAKENDTSQYQVNRQTRGIDNPVHDYTFKFKDNVKCVGLKYLDNDFWDHDNGKYGDQFPTEIYFNPDNKIVLIKFKDLLQIFVYRQKIWRLMFNAKPDPVDVDITNKESSAGYDYFKNDGLSTAIFLPKANYIYNSVKLIKPGCCSKPLELWSANDWTQYAYKVTRDGIGSTKSLKNVTVHLINGDTKTFKKSGRCSNKKWREVITFSVRGPPVSTFNKSEYRCKEETEHKPAYVKFKFDGDTKENDTSQYSIISFSSRMGAQETIDSYRYDFNLDSKCVEVNISETVFWKHEAKDSESDDESDHFPYIVFYSKSGTGSVRITFRDSLWVLYKYGTGNRWHKTDGNLESRGPSELDLKKNKGKGFEFYDNDSTKSKLYLAKPKCWFNKVTQGNDLVFEAKDKDEYVLKVLVTSSDTSQSPQTPDSSNQINSDKSTKGSEVTKPDPASSITTFLYLTLVDGRTKKLKKGTDGKFVESS